MYKILLLIFLTSCISADKTEDMQFNSLNSFEQAEIDRLVLEIDQNAKNHMITYFIPYCHYKDSIEFIIAYINKSDLYNTFKNHLVISQDLIWILYSMNYRIHLKRVNGNWTFDYIDLVR
jgi:hypothetical protein